MQTDLKIRSYNKGNTNASLVKLTDADLVFEVEDAIKSDPEIPFSDKKSITVRAKKGVVWLAGEVLNLNSKVRALTIAFWCEGVDDVKDRIQVML